ncbi:MAG TPA: MFS transporter [Rubrivivax sp.]|nr:MFS transporter [Rubrivivax sp.]
MLAFAFAYFLSALLRAVTATLAPVFSAELGLQPADLGLLAGAYFLGFAALQLPLGRALDRFGPRRVLLVLLSVAVIGCGGFALAQALAPLIAARLLIGMGVAACLMAPLTCFRHIFGHGTQLRLNSWMLMTGSLGMLASTLPVQWLLPHWGWRGLFVAVAALLALAMAGIAAVVPRTLTAPAVHAAPSGGGCREIMRQPVFVALAPLAFFSCGALIAIQALWAGPWLTQVAGWSADQAAQGLFAINLCMLLAFMSWGVLMLRLARQGVQALQLIAWGAPLSVLVLLAIAALGPRAGALHWALWCVLSTCVTLSQPLVAQAFPPAWAGRALSAFNLLIFGGVFCLQWGIGLAVEAFAARGWPRSASLRGAMLVFALCCALAQLWFLWRQRRMVIIEGRVARR